MLKKLHFFETMASLIPIIYETVGLYDRALLQEKYLYKELNLFLWWEWLKMRGLLLKGVEPWEDLYWKEVLDEKLGRPEAQRVILRLVPGDVFSEIKSQNVKPWIQTRPGYADPYSNSAVCFVAIQSVRFSFWDIFQNYFTLFTFCKFFFRYTFM